MTSADLRPRWACHAALVGSLVLAACGGGGGSDGSSNDAVSSASTTGAANASTAVATADASGSASVVSTISPTTLASSTAEATSQRESALAAETWNRIAGESQSFSVSGTQRVRYGSGSRWTERTVTGSGWCTNAFFNGDPAPGVAKQCEVLTSSSTTTPTPTPTPSPAPTSGWTRIASEYQTFTVSGTQRVRFGADTRWRELSLSGTRWCNSQTFGGDPAPNVAKQCEVASSGGSTTPTTPTTPTPAPSTPTVSSGLAHKPFASSSPWKTPIPSNASYASSGDARVRAFQSIASKLSVNTRQYTQWVYTAKSSDPQVSVNVAARNLPGNGYLSDALNRAGTVTLRMPSNAQPDPMTDKHMTVIDVDGRYAHEFWYMYRDGSGWKAVAYAKVDLTGDGTMISGESVVARFGNYHNPNVVNFGWGATRAYGGSSMAGLIRSGEVTSGTIDHALYMSLPHYVLRMPSAGQLPVYPASRNDTSAGYDPTHIIMGTRFAIPRSVNIYAQGFSPAGLKLAQALQNYGAYVLDQSGIPNLNSDGVAAQADGDALNAQKADMAKIHALLTIVQ